MFKTSKSFLRDEFIYLFTKMHIWNVQFFKIMLKTTTANADQKICFQCLTLTKNHLVP
jgi:hypothetical protein